MAERLPNSLVARSGPTTATLLALSRSPVEKKRPRAISNWRTGKNSGVTPAIEDVLLTSPACTTSLRVIWGATRFTLGTCSAMALASSKTRFFGKSMPWRRVSLFPGTTNSTLAPRLLN